MTALLNSLAGSDWNLPLDKEHSVIAVYRLQSEDKLNPLDRSVAREPPKGHTKTCASAQFGNI